MRQRLIPPQPASVRHERPTEASYAQSGLHGKHAGPGRQDSGRACSHQPHLELGPVVPKRRMGRPEPEKRALHERLTRASCAHHRHRAG